jgi:hypothetical protein
MKRHLVWLVTAPLVFAGVETGHAIGNALFAPGDAELFESAASGRQALAPIVTGLVGLVLIGLVTRTAGLWASSRQSKRLAASFALLPLLAFLVLEVLEALTTSGGWHSLLGGAFAVGLALQLPVALAAYVLARGLLRLSDEVRMRLVARSMCAVEALEVESGAPVGEAPRTRPAFGVVRGRAPPLRLVAGT